MNILTPVKMQTKLRQNADKKPNAIFLTAPHQPLATLTP
jgi:hypothetical protein